MRTLALALSLAIALACAIPTQASILTFNVFLDGAQAGTPSPGTGAAIVVLDNVAQTLLVDLTYSGLLAPTTNAHIHCCAPPGSSAPVIIPFVPPFVTGATSGSFTSTFDLTAMQVSQIESFQSYINIHTTLFPAGEIRGNIVPEPTTLTLISAALAGLAVLRYRVKAG